MFNSLIKVKKIYAISHTDFFSSFTQRHLFHSIYTSEEYDPYMNRY